MTEHLDIVLWISGLIGAGLMWFAVSWMHRKDKFQDTATSKLGDLEKELSLSVADRRNLHDQFNRLMTKIDKHIDEEPEYWKENSKVQTQILTELAALSHLEKHVSEHNRESEIWKQRIVKLEQGLHGRAV